MLQPSIAKSCSSPQIEPAEGMRKTLRSNKTLIPGAVKSSYVTLQVANFDIYNEDKTFYLQNRCKYLLLLL